MRVSVVCFFLFFVSKSLFSQQEMQSFMYVYDPLLYNPAYAGVADYSSLSLHFNKQWINMDGSPVSVQMAGSAVLEYDFSLGGIFQYEKLGVTQHTVADFMLTYKVETFSGIILSMGVGGGVCVMDKNFSDMDDLMCEDVYYKEQQKRETLPHGQFGVLLHSESFRVSCSAKGLWETNQNSDFGYKQRTHFYFSCEKDFRMNKQFELSVAGMATLTRSSPVSVEFFPTMEYEETFSLGLSYRTDHYGGVNFRVNVSPCFYIGGAYVHSLNELAGAKMSSSFELMLGVRSPKKDEVDW